MGGVSTEASNGNVELNLVPFIDLLSSLVLFLLLSAVWVHVSAMPTAIDAKGTAIVTSGQPNLMTIRLVAKGYEITYPPTLQKAGLPTMVEKAGTGFDLVKIATIAQQIGNLVKGGTTAPITAISADDVIEYGEVIRAIDAVRNNGIANVALSAN